ncbi:MAG: hypothetical protein ACHQ6U_08230 [Thermodesulfobacteriota bacterium]
MAGGQALTETEILDISNYISLKQYPPKLRKLAKFLLESDAPMTISEACRALDLNIESIFTMINRTRRKGNDFSEFINEQSQMLLRNNRLAVYNAVVQGAVSGSSTAHNQQKLFSQLTGDLKESPNINIGSLTLGININSLAITDSAQNKGIIDIEPVIPKGEC